jgi:hypothetical protein
MEMDTTVAFGVKKRQFLLTMPKGVVSAGLPLFNN